MNATYSLLFAGQPMPGVDPTQLRAILTERLKLTQEQAERMFSGKPVSLKRFTDGAEAERYRAHFTAMGAQVWIDTIAPPRPAVPSAPPAAQQPPIPPAPPPAPQAAEEIVCPNCGERQPKRTLCRSCSTDMPRVLAAKKEAEAEARAASLQAIAQEKGAGPRQGNASVELALETPSVIGWGLSGRIGRVTYLLGNLAMTALMVPIVILGLKMDSLVVMAVLLILAALVCLRITALRCNDLGWSKWLTLIELVPYVGGIFSLILLAVPGERRDNVHGAPTPIAGWVPFAFCLIMAVGSVFSVRHEIVPMAMQLAMANGRFSTAQSRPTSQETSYRPDGRTHVVLYTDDSCSDCEKRRGELHRAGIAYQEISLDKDPTGHGRLQASVERSGMMGQTVCTPILEVNGIVLPKEVGVAELQALLQGGS